MLRRSVLAGLAAVLISAGVASSAPPVPVPPYLQDDFNRVALGSNTLWKTAKAVAKGSPLTVLNAKAKPDISQPIWAPTCPAAAQTVTFRRTVWLPGPPNSSGQFIFSPWLGASMVGALTTFDLIVNGKVVAHKPVVTRSQTIVNLDAAALRAFRAETNDIEVRVHKRAEKAACNTPPFTSALTANRLGVQWVLLGGFQTDAQVTPGHDEFHKLALNATRSTAFTVSFGNNGPGLSPKGHFHLAICCPTQFLLGSSSTIPLSSYLTNCKDVANGASHAVDCDLTSVPPGAKGIFGAFFQVKGPAVDYSDFNTSISWWIATYGVSELDQSNNQGRATVTYCGTRATSAGCQTAS